MNKEQLMESIFDLRNALIGAAEIRENNIQEANNPVKAYSENLLRMRKAHKMGAGRMANPAPAKILKKSQKQKNAAGAALTQKGQPSSVMSIAGSEKTTRPPIQKLSLPNTVNAGPLKKSNRKVSPVVNQMPNTVKAGPLKKSERKGMSTLKKVGIGVGAAGGIGAGAYGGSRFLKNRREGQNNSPLGNLFKKFRG